MSVELQLFERPSVLEVDEGLESKKAPDHYEMEGNKDQQHESVKGEIRKVKDENEKLKSILSRTLNDYQMLRRYFFDINVQQEGDANKSLKPTSSAATIIRTSGHGFEGTELTTLSLGNSLASTKNEEKKVNNKNSEKMGGAHLVEGLDLGLDCKFQGSDQSPQKSCEEEKAEEWPPSKLAKAPRSSEDDMLQQAYYAKKARVSVRIRCDTQTMEDGCQWRKYGQKTSKGNPCPRAYYRCTAAPSCPVKKQVQRCAEDMSMLITTYEGTHNHSLPVQATAMASTTSAAARMLMSTSSTSTSGTSNLAGFTVDLSDDKSRSSSFYLPNSAFAASPCHPTITLNLTSRSSSHQFNSLPSTFSSIPKRFPSTGLPNFISSNQGYHLLNSWNSSPNTSNSCFSSYGPQLNSKAMPSALSRPPYESLYQTNLQKLSPVSSSTSLPSSQQHFPRAIESVAKTTASEPSFRSVLAAAITSAASGRNNGSHPLQVKDKTGSKFGKETAAYVIHGCVFINRR